MNDFDKDIMLCLQYIFEGSRNLSHNVYNEEPCLEEADESPPTDLNGTHEPPSKKTSEEHKCKEPSERCCCQGPPGKSGPIGPPGEPGPMGPRGPQGPSGCQGERGMTGPQGVTGPQGLQGVTGPQGPAGQQGCRGPMGPAGFTQNSVFAAFAKQDILMPENALLPFKTTVPDVTGNILPQTECSVMLSSGYYSIYYYVASRIKKPGFMEVIPMLDGKAQPTFAGTAATKSQDESVQISREFIIEIPYSTLLDIEWKCTENASRVNMNVNIVKLCR